MKWVDVCSMYGGKEKYMQSFGEEIRGKEQLTRARPRWEENIKMNLQDVGCGNMDWIELAQAAGSRECDDEHLASIKCGEFF